MAMVMVMSSGDGDVAVDVDGDGDSDGDGKTCFLPHGRIVTLWVSSKCESQVHETNMSVSS